MEKIVKKVLIFGSAGMIGHKVFQVLSSNSDLILFNTSRSKLNDSTECADFREHDQILDVILKVKPDVVVNAAGISDFISNEASSLCRIRSPKSFED